MDCGGNYSLKTYGAQDVWVNNLPEDAFNPEVFLKDKRYQRVYQKLNVQTYLKSEHKGVFLHELRLDFGCHLIHKVDAYLKGTTKVNDVLKTIETVYGGSRFDKIQGDIETILTMNAAILKSNRRVEYTDTKTIVPLLMAPFHDINLVPPQLAYHSLSIRIHSMSEEDIELYADCYYIQDHVNNSRSCLTVQTNDIGGDFSLKKGINTIKLYFNHPMICLYLWGFDKKKINNITLRLETHKDIHANTDFYNGGIEPLEYYKKSRGITEEPVCIFFSNVDLTKRPNSTVNFSRLDYPQLIIDTKEDSPLNIVGLCYQGYKYEFGMIGLQFSK